MVPLTNLFLLVHEQSVGVGWFGIFLQLFLTLGVLHTLASDSIAMHRFQISVFGAIAIVMAVITVSNSIFTGLAALDAMAAGWLIIAIVDILWVIYFTSEEDSLAFHLFNSMGTGGLTPPSRRRRTRGASNIGANGYTANYSPGGGVGSHDMPYDSANKTGGIGAGPGVRSQNSFVGGASVDGAPRSLGPAAGVGSVHSTPNPAPVSLSGPDNSMGPGSPLIGPGAAGVGAGGGTGGSPNIPEANPGGPEAYVYKAKALYACKPRGLSLIFFCLSLAQTQPLQMIQTKSHSLRVRFLISSTSKASGGKQRKQTVH